jgi:aspartate/tyrosine/aromatic aminotransferase
MMLHLQEPMLTTTSTTVEMKINFVELQNECVSHHECVSRKFSKENPQVIEQYRLSMQSASEEEFNLREKEYFSSMLNPLARKKSGDDPIFRWFSRYLKAKQNGRDAVNGTLGSLIDDSGELALNETVIDSLRNQVGHDMAGYSPLRGMPAFRELAIELALGQYRSHIPAVVSAIATPGGCGALYASACNFADPGDKVLLRDKHWGPYKTILSENGLNIHSYPLWDSNLELRASLSELALKQNRILGWLNDPAHNPTGLSLSTEERKNTLSCWLDSALNNPEIGHTLLIDAAYHLYADEPHGWAETISKIENWPNNLLILFALSCSKSHTIYGMRTGALVYLHPDSEVHSKLGEVLLHTGRGTWSGAPRLPQVALIDVHQNQLNAWEDEKNQLKAILTSRRRAFNDAAASNSIEVMPNDDGYFAFIECNNPEEVCESCAEDDVYLVPLIGGIRVGICAIPASDMPRVASALAKALR